MLENFNSFCRQEGREYENAVIAHEILTKKAEVIGRDVDIPGSGIQMDVIMADPVNNGTVKFIQAKGGKPGEGKRPGAQRTDNVKKAIADGALLKSIIPDSWYTVYFSEKPKSGSSSEFMINTALRVGMVDEVNYLSYT